MWGSNPHPPTRSNYAVCLQAVYVLAENLETAQKRKGGGLRKQRTSEVRHEADCQRSLKIVGGLWEHIEKPYVRVVMGRSWKPLAVKGLQVQILCTAFARKIGRWCVAEWVNAMKCLLQNAIQRKYFSGTLWESKSFLRGSNPRHINSLSPLSRVLLQ